MSAKQKLALNIISADGDSYRYMIGGYYVASGAGDTFRIYGWAKDMRLAKKLRAAVRRNPSEYIRHE